MRTVFFVSDSTGITAETLGSALMAQFDNVEYRKVTLPFVADEDQAEEARAAIEQAARDDDERPVVFSTLTKPSVYDAVSRCDALVLDLFNVFTAPLEEEFKLGSTHLTGRYHGVVDRESYENRIDAVDYALNHDDGQSFRNYNLADVILVGVSRSGKTPTCIYLALQFGLRAANYPLTEDDLARSSSLPTSLEPFKRLLFGLTIDPEHLHRIRQARRPDSRYASVDRCRKEVRDATLMFRHLGIPYLDTTDTSVEEIAARILKRAGLKRRRY